MRPERRRVSPLVVINIILVVVILVGGGLAYRQLAGREAWAPPGLGEIYYEAEPAFSRSLAVVEKADVADAAEQTVTYGEKVIYGGYITLEVENAVESQSAVENLVQAQNGFIAESQRWQGSQEEDIIRLVVRVPAERFRETLSDLATLGEVIEESMEAQDVSERYYDLETRLATKQAQEQRYLEILASAERVEDVLQVERELERIRVDIESMQGSLRYLKDRVDLSTITVTLQEKPQITAGSSNLRNILNQMSETFFSSLRLLFIVFAAVVPWVAVVAGAGIVIALAAAVIRR